MTSNNLEAIQKLRWLEYWYDENYSVQAVKKVREIVALLQADEDIEVQDKPTCKKCDEISNNWFMSLAGNVGKPRKCDDHAKPTKETKQSKLMKLKYRVTPEVNILANVVLDLIDLLEEEY